MPAKSKHVVLPDWVERIDDPCLVETITEALVARRLAERLGAPDQRPCRSVFAAGDKTLDAIADGRVRGQVACRKAAVALRKFNTALECVRPTARRNGH